jgi:hypothetical protein
MHIKTLGVTELTKWRLMTPMNTDMINKGELMVLLLKIQLIVHI